MINYILNKDKYKAAFLYIAKALGKIEGKKKAYKLFYYLDFDFYEAYERPFTGDNYKAFPMGPVPMYFDAIIQELVEEGGVEIKKTRMLPTHDNDAVIFEPRSDPNYKFSGEEKKMLDRIVRLYGQHTGKMLEDLSHSEAPYNAVDLYQVIPYEYSFYRDTTNLIS